MAIHDIARNLPFLRRFARALTGSVETGDTLVAATLQSLIDGRAAIDRPVADRTALFAALWRNRATRIALGPSTATGGGMDPTEERLHALAPLERATFLLVMVEQIEETEAAQILEISPSQVRSLLSEVRDQLEGVRALPSDLAATQIRVPNRSG